MDNKEICMITEHMIELLHEFSGSFLDNKGLIADKVRAADNIFTDWKITPNSIEFFNAKDLKKQNEAIMGCNLIRYITYDPSSKNYFEEKSKKFFKFISNIKEYNIPNGTRFGIRSKCFVQIDKTFNEIYKAIFEKFFNKDSASVFGGRIEDLMYVVNIKESKYSMRLSFGPVNNNEVTKYMSFQSDDFNRSGIFFDIDCFYSHSFVSNEINNLISESIKLTSEKIDRIVLSLGI